VVAAKERKEFSSSRKTENDLAIMIIALNIAVSDKQ